MGQLLNVVTPLHKRTKRDYLARMVDDKVHCMLKAKEYEFDYWDGDRRYGYGGYRYDGRWKIVAAAAHRSLRPADRRHGFSTSAAARRILLHELKQLLPDADVTGFDVSKHGLADAPEPIRPYLFRYRAQDPLSVRRPALRSGDLAWRAAQPARCSSSRPRVARDRARRQAEVHHARELPERARAVQPRSAGR